MRKNSVVAAAASLLCISAAIAAPAEVDKRCRWLETVAGQTPPVGDTLKLLTNADRYIDRDRYDREWARVNEALAAMHGGRIWARSRIPSGFLSLSPDGRSVRLDAKDMLRALAWRDRNGDIEPDGYIVIETARKRGLADYLAQNGFGAVVEVERARTEAWGIGARSIGMLAVPSELDVETGGRSVSRLTKDWRFIMGGTVSAPYVEELFAGIPATFDRPHSDGKSARIVVVRDACGGFWDMQKKRLISAFPMQPAG